MRLAPLRPVDRILAGYSTLAFAMAAGQRMMLREWRIAVFGLVMSVAGVALLMYDHRRWRAGRRATSRDTSTETS